MALSINKHEIIHAKDAGNGYHGYCKHCNVPLVTDLGYCSWEGVKCIDREIVNSIDIPETIASYASFRGLIWNGAINKYVKPYSSEEFTLSQLQDIIINLYK